MERKPRLLIVGAGMMGREHLRVSQLLGWADVQGIVDPDGGSLEWACADWRLLTNAPLTIYRDLNEACGDEAVDAIVIATPNHTHRDVLHAVASCAQARVAREADGHDLGGRHGHRESRAGLPRCHPAGDAVPL